MMSQAQIPAIFSRPRRELGVARAASRNGTSWLYEAMQDDVAERLDFMQLTPRKAMLVGHDTCRLESILTTAGERVTCLREHDEEHPLGFGDLDLLVSLSRLDTVNDLPGALIHARNALAPGGLMIAQIIGAGSMLALREVMLAADGERPAAHVHPQIDDRAGTALLQRVGFSKQVVDTHKLTVRYSALETLIGDLRDQALSSVLLSPAPYVGKAGLARAKARFDELREDDGKVSETFQILTLTAWR